MSYSESERLETNKLPARRGAVLALAVDVTPRPYDLTALNLSGVYKPKQADQVCLTLRAVTADIWYQFSDVTGATLDPAAVLAAGSALAYANTYGAVLPAGQEIRVHIRKDLDKWLIIRTSAATATLILYASSESTGSAV